MENVWSPEKPPIIPSEKSPSISVRVTKTAHDRLGEIYSSVSVKSKVELLSELIMKHGSVDIPIRDTLKKVVKIEQLIEDRLEDPAKLRFLLREISDQRVGFDKLLEALTSVNGGMQKMELGSQNFVAQHEKMIADLQKFANSYESTFSEWVGQIEKRMSVAGKVQAHLAKLGEATNQLTKSLKKRERSAVKSKQNLEKLFSDLEEYRSAFGSSVSETLRLENEKHSKEQKWLNSVLLLITTINMAGLSFLVWRSLT